MDAITAVAMTTLMDGLTKLFRGDKGEGGEGNADQSELVLREQVALERHKAEIALQRARVVQELAIANRIEQAHEVEIEEYYAAAGKGSVGAAVDEGVTLGLTGRGQKVTRRVYRFIGRRDDEVIVAVDNPHEPELGDPPELLPEEGDSGAGA